MVVTAEPPSDDKVEALSMQHQSPAPDLIAAARAIAQVYDDLGRPEWFAGWLRRIARDFEQDGAGAPRGTA